MRHRRRTEYRDTENGSQPSFIGSSDYFTGTAIVDRLFAPNDDRTTSAGHVTFAPGARSAWHTQPAGQTLIVTSGTGWIQEWGGKKREIKPGDVIWTPPGVKHGLTEDVIADLARNNELLVIARNSTFATSTHGLAARPTGLGSSG